jgi:hypothetical protein
MSARAVATLRAEEDVCTFRGSGARHSHCYSVVTSTGHDFRSTASVYPAIDSYLEVASQREPSGAPTW